MFDRIIIKSIDPSDSDTIDQHEIDSLTVFPATNERLHLCWHFGRNLDPDKDIMFNRKMPLDYLTYVDIGLAATIKEKRRLWHYISPLPPVNFQLAAVNSDWPTVGQIVISRSKLR